MMMVYMVAFGGRSYFTLSPVYFIADLGSACMANNLGTSLLSEHLAVTIFADIAHSNPPQILLAGSFLALPFPLFPFAAAGFFSTGSTGREVACSAGTSSRSKTACITHSRPDYGNLFIGSSID